LATKPENTFIASVNAHLKDVYHEKMYNPYRAGTADVWYSGAMGDVWVEYKFIPKIPKSLEIVPALTDRQLKWLSDRHAEGRNVVVILGCPDGGVLFRNRTWESPMTSDEMKARIMSRKDLAGLIRGITGVSPCLTRSLEPLKLARTSTKS